MLVCVDGCTSVLGIALNFVLCFSFLIFGWTNMHTNFEHAGILSKAIFMYAVCYFCGLFPRFI